MLLTTRSFVCVLVLVLTYALSAPTQVLELPVSISKESGFNSHINNNELGIKYLFHYK